MARTGKSSARYIRWVIGFMSLRLVVAALKALALLTKGKLKAAKSGIKPFLTSLAKSPKAKKKKIWEKTSRPTKSIVSGL